MPPIGRICLNSDPENFCHSPGGVQCMITHWWRVMLMMFMTRTVEPRMKSWCVFLGVADLEICSGPGKNPAWSRSIWLVKVQCLGFPKIPWKTVPLHYPHLGGGNKLLTWSHDSRSTKKGGAPLWWWINVNSSRFILKCLCIYLYQIPWIHQFVMIVSPGIMISMFYHFSINWIFLCHHMSIPFL